MAEDRNAHLGGLVRLFDDVDRTRIKRWMATESGRPKLLARLQHNMEPDRKLTSELPRGQRGHSNLLRAFRRLGAPDRCYIISSDGRLDDTFQDLDAVLLHELGNFSHGTIISAIPGRLALFRSAFPFRHLIVHRPD
jgi:hypothetical protein